MRVATIDIGTNTVLLLVAETRGAHGELVAVDEQATITRLGQGVDRTRTLAPEAIARTNACLDAYAERLRDAKVDRVAVVGTSAMRDAHGGALVAEHVKRVLGVEARVINGEEEARLTFVGALGGLRDLPASVVVFDIGGGSTEVVHGDAQRRVRYASSLDVGSVRLTERHVRSDPPTAAEREAIVADVRRAWSAHPELGALRSSEPIGIAGTVTTLAAVAKELAVYDGARVHGMRMSLAEVKAVVERLASVTLEERRTLTGMEPKRADVIVAGGLVTLALLELLGASGMRVSDRGVRWGLAADLVADGAATP
jgi:exopolyphosphatase/guanosine-5'-triphosphate,3'-diphosphate pyrophosphatase